MEIIYAMAGGGGQGGGLAMYLPFILIMLIIYLFMIRPNVKRQKEKQRMLEALKKGDKVITIGGIHGIIAGFRDNKKVIILKIAKNADIAVNKSAVAGLVGQVTEEETASMGARS